MFTKPLFENDADVKDCSFLITEDGSQLFKIRCHHQRNFKVKQITPMKQLYAIRVTLKHVGERLCK